MKKKDLIKALQEIDDKVQEAATKNIDEMGKNDLWSTSTLFKSLDYAEAQAIKAHGAFEWVIQMIEDNYEHD